MSRSFNSVSHDDRVVVQIGRGVSKWKVREGVVSHDVRIDRGSILLRVFRHRIATPPLPPPSPKNTEHSQNTPREEAREARARRAPTCLARNFNRHVLSACCCRKFWERFRLITGTEEAIFVIFFSFFFLLYRTGSRMHITCRMSSSPLSRRGAPGGEIVFSRLDTRNFPFGKYGKYAGRLLLCYRVRRKSV